MSTCHIRMSNISIIIMFLSNSFLKNKPQSSKSLSKCLPIITILSVSSEKNIYKKRNRNKHSNCSTQFLVAIKGAVSFRFSQGLLTLMCNILKLNADIDFFFFVL